MLSDWWATIAILSRMCSAVLDGITPDVFDGMLVLFASMSSAPDASGHSKNPILCPLADCNASINTSRELEAGPKM